MSTEAIKLWDSLENFAGYKTALVRDGEDRVHIELLQSTKTNDPIVYNLTDPEWIRWQAVIEAAPAMLAALKAVIDNPRPAAGSISDWNARYNRYLAAVDQARAAIAKAESE